MKWCPVVGSFSKTVNLVLGTNTFTIAITDAAGNSTTRMLSVTRAGAKAFIVLVIVLMVLVKMALVKKQRR